MLNLQLLFPKSQPAAAALAAGSFPTTLNAQPAAGSAAPTAPSDPFARTSQPGADLEAVRAGIRNIVESFPVDLSVAHSIALGNALVIPIQGTAFMIDKGADVGNATLHIQDQSNNPVNSIAVFPGDSFNLPFTFMMVENTAQPAKVLRIHYGTGIQFLPSLAGTLAISGNVSILLTASGAPQGADKETSDNHAFGEFNTVAAGGAGNFSVVGVANPNASGKRTYVDAFRWTAGAAMNIFVCQSTAAQVAGASAFHSRLNGGADAAHTIRQGTVVAVPFGTQTDIDTAAVANAPQEFRPRNPWILDPNTGLYVVAALANTQLAVSFQTREF